MSREARMLMLLALTIAVWLARPAHAQNAPAPQSGGSTPPSASAASQSSRAADGAQIAQAGTPNGAAPCMSCHGAHGEGMPAGGFPRLAGQSSMYLARQLAAYADGHRENPVMTPIAKALTPEQREAVAAYYETLDAPVAKEASAHPGANAASRARTLANVGDNTRRVQACANCHGPDGRGEAPAYPYLAGQNATYLTASLKEWKDGTRNTDPSAQMSMIGKSLSDDDIAALAQYFASEPPPALDRVLAAQRARTTQRTAVTSSGPPPGATPAAQQGVGSEQGAATTGGGQGIGGGGAASGSGPSGSPSGDATTQKR